MERILLFRAAAALALAGMCVPACANDQDSALQAGTHSNEPPFVPVAGGLRRIRARQYTNSIRVLLGDSAAAAAAPPDDEPLHGFDAIGAAELSYPTSAIEQLETSANAVATAAVMDGSALSQYFSCTPGQYDDDACYQEFVRNLGHVAWRRPLDADELTRLTTIAQDAESKYGAFDAGLEYAISAIIQSPNFLYIIELGQPDADSPTMRRLTPTELATRISFALVDATPDASTLQQVEQNGLSGDQIKDLARSLLTRPEAHTTLQAFYGEIFKLRDLLDPGTVPKDGTLFPNFTPTLRQALVEETMRLIDELAWTDGSDFRDLLTADYAYVNKELAAFYGLPAPQGDDFEKIPLPPDQGRAGLLGSASYLARWGHPTATSPTRRGLFVRNMILCQTIDPPPPNVNQQLPPDDPMAPETLKQKLEQHRTDPACAGCHKLMDPIGLSLEHYDAIGAYRTVDNGLPIDTTTQVSDIGNFASASELGGLLHDDDRVPACMVKTLLRNALGHMETDGEKVVIDEVGQSFADSGYRMQDLLVELVASRTFQFVGDPK